MLSSHIVFHRGATLQLGEPDDPERGVGVGVGDLPLERLQAPTQHPRLAGVQLGSQPLESVPIGRVKIDLNRFGCPPGFAGPFMGSFHDS